MTAAPTTEELLSKEMLKQAGLDSTTTPALDPNTKVTGTQLQEKSNEILAQQTLGTSPIVATGQAPTTNLDVSVPQSSNVSTYSAYTTPNTPTASAVAGTLNSQAIIGNIQGAVSQSSQASAAQGTVDPKATVQFQLSELFKARISFQ